MTSEKTKVLIVEDEGLVAMDLKARLERSGYSVPDIAETAEQAIQMTSSCRPDLVLMDIRLRGTGDGILAAEQVRRDLDIPVIFVSSHSDPETLRRAVGAEAFGYITKPFGATSFKPHIEMAIRKHRTERELRQSVARGAGQPGEPEREARHTQNMEGIAITAASLAHDFANLLSIIMGYTQLVQLDEKRRCSEVDAIGRAAKVAAGLARQLLVLCREDSTRLVVLDLNELLLANAEMLRAGLGRGRCLDMTTTSEPLLIRADTGKLQQLLLNLMVNARDAMPDGGRVTVTTCETDSGLVRLSISDTGVGMDIETLARIFEPYFSRKGDRGTGLGLTIAHTIVSQLGGQIHARSQPGSGTVFEISLPRAERECETGDSDASHSAGPVAARTVLIVEDNSEICLLLRQHFERAGFRTLAAASGEEALALDELGRETIDLLITDLRMAGMGGAELACQWVERFPGTRVLFVSGFGENILQGNKLLASGQAEYLAKPLTATSLLLKAQSMLARCRDENRGAFETSGKELR